MVFDRIVCDYTPSHGYIWSERTQCKYALRRTQTGYVFNRPSVPKIDNQVASDELLYNIRIRTLSSLAYLDT